MPDAVNSVGGQSSSCAVGSATVKSSENAFVEQAWQASATGLQQSRSLLADGNASGYASAPAGVRISELKALSADEAATKTQARLAEYILTGDKKRFYSALDLAVAYRAQGGNSKPLFEIMRAAPLELQLREEITKAEQRADALFQGRGHILALNRENINYGGELDGLLRKISLLSGSVDENVRSLIKDKLVALDNKLSGVDMVKNAALQKVLIGAGYGYLLQETKMALAREELEGRRQQQERLAKLPLKEHFQEVLQNHPEALLPVVDGVMTAGVIYGPAFERQVGLPFAFKSIKDKGAWKLVTNEGGVVSVRNISPDKNLIHLEFTHRNGDISTINGNLKDLNMQKMQQWLQKGNDTWEVTRDMEVLPAQLKEFIINGYDVKNVKNFKEVLDHVLGNNKNIIMVSTKLAGKDLDLFSKVIHATGRMDEALWETSLYQAMRRFNSEYVVQGSKTGDFHVACIPCDSSYFSIFKHTMPGYIVEHTR